MDDAPDPQLPTMPTAPGPPPMFGQMTAGQKKKPKKKPEGMPSFLGTEEGGNPTNTGQKTLLGA